MTDPLEQLADGLAARMTSPADPTSVPVSRRWARVVNVLAVGTYDIELAQSGVTIPAVRALGYGAFVAGEYVVVDFTGPDPLIMGTADGQDGWHDVAAFANGWVNYGAGGWPNAAYRKVHGVVYLNGLIKNGGVGVAFTLPTAYRPGRQTLFGTDTSGGHGRIDVFPSGDVTVVNLPGNAYLTLDPIRFVAEL